MSGETGLIVRTLVYFRVERAERIMLDKEE